MDKNNQLTTQLWPCSDQQLIAVFRWFNSEKSVLYWSGPGVTYPLQIKRFKTESKFHKSHAYVLKQGREVLAFGQIYNRLDHCHLGRLVVSPKHRGQGVGSLLIDALIEQGQSLLGLSNASLFVLADNQAALSLYKKSGFVETTYPQQIPLEHCLYMTRPAAAREKLD